VVRELDIEAGPEEDRQHALDLADHRLASGPALLEDAAGPWVAQHDPASIHRQFAKRRLPGQTRRRRLHLADHDRERAVEQVVLVADMAVQRHRVDGELLAELAHAQRLGSAAIGDIHGRREDALAREWLATALERGRAGGRRFDRHRS